MNVSELTGADLDAAVALCEGDGLVYTVIWPSLKPLRKGRPYSTDWNYGGPIIARERISLLPPGYGGSSGWEAGIGARNTYDDGWEAEFAAEGPTALIAAMRCYVAASRAKIT